MQNRVSNNLESFLKLDSFTKVKVYLMIQVYLLYFHFRVIPARASLSMHFVLSSSLMQNLGEAQ